MKVTNLLSPASSRLVVVADPLQLTAARELPDHQLQAPPQTFTVEEHEELRENPAEKNMRRPASEKKLSICGQNEDDEFNRTGRKVSSVPWRGGGVCSGWGQMFTRASRAVVGKMETSLLIVWPFKLLFQKLLPFYNIISFISMLFSLHSYVF